MTERPIDLEMLSRIDSEQKATASRVDGLDKALQGVAREVSEIRGRLERESPAPTPWWLTHVLGPLCVASAVATVTAVIILLVKVNGIETFIHNNGGFIAALRLEKDAANPSAENSVKDTRRIIGEATAAKVRVSREVLASTGQKFIDAAQTMPTAWDAVPDFLSYASFLNTYENLPALGPLRDFTTYGFNIPTHDSLRVPTMSHYGTVPISKAALLDRIGQHKNITNNNGDAFVVLADGEVLLDGMSMKHVILRNITVYYDGGPVILEESASSAVLSLCHLNQMCRS